MQKYSPGLLEVAIATISEAKLPVVQAVVFPQGGGAIQAGEAGCHRVRPASRGSQRVPVQQLGGSGDERARWRAWVRTNWAKVEPHTFGFYVNEFNADDAARLRDTYGANFDRLVALKTKYDPGNLFRLNANVAPKARS